MLSNEGSNLWCSGQKNGYQTYCKIKKRAGNNCFFGVEHRYVGLWLLRGEKAEDNLQMHRSFLPKSTFQTAVGGGGAHEQQPGWRKQMSVSAPEPAAVLLPGTREERASPTEESPETYKGVCFSPCPNTKLHSCRTRFCVCSGWDRSGKAVE